jgi:hypothetical protein
MLNAASAQRTVLTHWSPVITGREVPVLLAAANHISRCTSGTTYQLAAPAIAVQHEAFRREYLGSGWLTRP